MNSDSRWVRGLSIATTILSALGVFGGVACLIFFIFIGVSLSDPAVLNQVIDTLQSGSPAFDGSNYGDLYTYDYSYLSPEDAAAAANLGMTALIVLSIGYIILKAVALVGGIMGLRNSANPAKFGSLFVWTIVSAVACLLAGSIVSMILFIIAAVLVSRLKRAAANPYGQQPYAYQQPYGQPQQPYAGQAPVQQQPPAQPAATLPPTAAAPLPAEPAPSGEATPQPAASATAPAEPAAPTEPAMPAAAPVEPAAPAPDQKPDDQK